MRPDFNKAKRLYQSRFTAEHAPRWAKFAAPGGKYHAPRNGTDMEWYMKTLFPGEEGCPGNWHCLSRDQSFPLGQWLNEPYEIIGHKGRTYN